MPSNAYLYLLLFALTNLVFFGVLAFFVLMTGRQQRRLKQLSNHLEELVAELDAGAVSHHPVPGGHDPGAGSSDAASTGEGQAEP